MPLLNRFQNILISELELFAKEQINIQIIRLVVIVVFSDEFIKYGI